MEEGGAIELVNFDCDGVLVDSEEISKRVLVAHLRETGLMVSPEEVEEHFLGPRLRDIVGPVEAAVEKTLGESWVRRFEARRDVVFETELRSIPGARDLLACLAGLGVPLCVASQGRLGATHRKLDLVDLSKFFPSKAVFSADEVARGKPHPDVFLHAAEAMGAEPGLCLVIEDSENGVAAAHRAGMQVFKYQGEPHALPSAADVPRLLGLPRTRKDNWARAGLS